jgi:hypothetical protein
MQKSDCSWRLSLSRRHIRIGRTNTRRGKSVFILRTIFERRPSYGEGVSDEDLTVILSGKNSIQEMGAWSDSTQTKTWSSSHVLGDEH